MVNLPSYISCSITYDKYFKEFDANENPKANIYLKISPKNEDRIFKKEYYVYNFKTFFGEMGSLIGVLLGWSFLSVLEMLIDFLDILIRKKLSVNELRIEERAESQEPGMVGSYSDIMNAHSTMSVKSSSSSVETEYIN